MWTCRNWIALPIAAVLLAVPAWAGSFHDRQVQRQQESEQQSASPEEVAKAKEVSVSSTVDTVWATTVQVLKSKGLTIDKANKDIGQITTEFQITNAKKPKQHGMRYVIDLRKISAAETGLRVAGFEQTRYNVLQPDPWAEPKYNAEESESLTKAIQEAMAVH